jgi:hypothetical protein
MSMNSDSLPDFYSATERKPSLLRAIVDEADMLDDEGKLEILRKLKIQKALKMTKILDERLQKNTLHYTENEIAEMVSKDRKEQYEQKIGS